MATEKKEVKPGFVLLHHPKLGLEKQVKKAYKKGLEAHERAGYLAGPLPKKAKPAEPVEAKEKGAPKPNPKKAASSEPEGEAQSEDEDGGN